MRSNMAFRLSAQNSLRINELPHDQGDEKLLLNSFKGGNDLRNQLGKAKPKNNQTLLSKSGASTFEKQLKKSEQEAMAQQVASLDHFKPAVTRDKTKNLIQSIKLRRRQKHMDALSRFKEDLQDYKQNLSNIYSLLVSDLEQVMSIKQTSIFEYLNSMTDKYLLSRQADVLDEIKEQATTYKIQSETKLNDLGAQLQNLKEKRGDVVNEICQDLREALIEIAFVLEEEAREIEDKEKVAIQQIEKQYYEKYKGKYEEIVEKQKQRSSKIAEKTDNVIKTWREIKEKYEIDTYTTDAESAQYRRPEKLRNLYDSIISLQQKNHEHKMTILSNLLSENPDSYSKVNIDKWNQMLKKANEYFDHNFDELIAEFVKARDQHQLNNKQRSEYCKNRMKYIENHTEEQIQEIYKQKIEPLCERNIKEQEQMIKDMTDYVEKHDDRENKVFEEFSKFIGGIGSENDKFIKEFTDINTKYEIQKAKVLDDDEQLVQKLNQQLNKLKQELKEALHHIKLEEVEQKCFEKVDQIQKAYRNCHEENKKLQQTRRPIIQQFMKKYQAKIAELMMLYSPERKAELEEKNKKDAEEEATKRLEKQEKKKAEEEARLIQQAKAKGGKPPAPAKKDPKKAAAELQQRKKAILAEIGTKAIQEFITQTGTTWLVYKNSKQICESFFVIEEKKKQEEGAEKKIEEEDENKKRDAPDEQIKDFQGLSVVNAKSFVQIQELIPFLDQLRQKIFDAICQKRQRIITESEEADEQMLQQSLIMLDNRLKAHYSLKGQIQSEIYVKRSGEITGHKKKYEKYARTTKQKVDLQTEKFNFLLQKGLECLKNHNSDQKAMKEHIPKCKNLSELQGMYSRTRQNYNSFGLTIKEIYGELDRLSSSQVETLLQKNEDFIKESKLMEQGGDYSDEEIKWYQEMLNQITTQIKQQQTKRKQKYEQLKQHSEKKRKQLLETFEKEYNLAVEELSARDGTGKKYGKPKRIAQEKTRLQMNKCQQAQINIDKMISGIAKQYEKHMKNSFNFISIPPTLEWRRKLMTLYSCITRYGKHIQAFKPDLKISEMIRVTYLETTPECKLTPEEEENDKKLKLEELQALGKLGEQKDDRIFMKYIEEIEKIISDQSRTIYVGDKTKYLTGNDKIPDFLRNYIKNMKKNAEDFRVSCIRDLRESCNKLSDLSKCIAELFFSSIQNHSLFQIQTSKQKFQAQFSQFRTSHKNKRIDHMRRLRPNLKNPKCQQQLKILDDEENSRNKEYHQKFENTEKQFKDNHFRLAEQFMNKLLNNYQFLLLYIDSMYLFEDFVVVPGDEIDNKNHLNVQKLMVMKQKGIKIDPKSERNLRRKWEGFDFTLFDIEERKFALKKIADDAPKEKDKKGGKKDSKDPKKQQQEVIESDPNKTKTIETYKTWRQKEVYDCEIRAKDALYREYMQVKEWVSITMEVDIKQNNAYQIKWRETADSLYLK